MANNPFLGALSPEGVAANLPALRGGKRLKQAIAGVSDALSRASSSANRPNIYAATGDVSLGGAATVSFYGENFLLKGLSNPTQEVASLRVFGTSTDYVTVYSRVPGAIGNSVLLVINAPGTAAAADSLVTSATPTVTWTPETGDVDASITALNAGSKLVYAVKTGTGGTLAAQASTALAGGRGVGIKLRVGQLVAQDGTAAGVSRAGTSNGTYVSRWESGRIDVVVDDADLAAGQAVPAGVTLTAGGLIQVSFVWSDPSCVAAAHVVVGA